MAGVRVRVAVGEAGQGREQEGGSGGGRLARRDASLRGSLPLMQIGGPRLGRPLEPGRPAAVDDDCGRARDLSSTTPSPTATVLVHPHPSPLQQQQQQPDLLPLHSRSPARPLGVRLSRGLPAPTNITTTTTTRATATMAFKIKATHQSTTRKFPVTGGGFPSFNQLLAKVSPSVRLAVWLSPTSAASSGLVKARVGAGGWRMASSAG
jgi:hypothetical protein